MTIGQFIREKRLEAGLSQRALGKAFDCEVTTQFISNVERGVCPMPVYKIPELARVLKCDPNEIVAVMCEEYESLLLSSIYGFKENLISQTKTQNEEVCQK